jgi:Type I phosphodiesterase / nucleotide pyrophosphatase
MTGTLPRQHGAVANGWLFRDLMEVWLWRQSNRLIDGEKIWEAGRRRDPSCTTANLFWWYNMAATHDIGVTPRPIYRSDGSKLPDCYTKPLELRGELTTLLGPFPLFNFWGPGTSIAATRWIADAKRPEISRTSANPLPPQYVNGRSLPLGCTSIAWIGPVCGELGFASRGLPDLPATPAIFIVSSCTGGGRVRSERP